MRDREILLLRSLLCLLEWVLVLAKSAAVLAASTSDGWDLEKPREITAVSRQIVPISAAGLQG